MRKQIVLLETNAKLILDRILTKQLFGDKYEIYGPYLIPKKSKLCDWPSLELASIYDVKYGNT